MSINMKTPEEITAEVIAANYEDEHSEDVLADLVDQRAIGADDVRSLITAAIVADRAQRRVLPMVDAEVSFNIEEGLVIESGDFEVVLDTTRTDLLAAVDAAVATPVAFTTLAAAGTAGSPALEVHILQDEDGDVVDVFRDAGEAAAVLKPTQSLVEETVWARGEYATARIEELTKQWEEATGSTASDYRLSGDDWAAGLDADEAAEISRLIEWRDQK